MSRLVETIKSENGVLLNIAFHNERMRSSLNNLFGIKKLIALEKEILIPEECMNGTFKCRVEYEIMIEKIEFVPYKAKTIKSLKLISDNSIAYAYKFVDRKLFDKYISMCAEDEDILIIKNGMVTDSSYANVVFLDYSGKWVTPSSFLLPGIQRSSLLERGIIHEEMITCNDLKKYREVRLINAMLGIDDTVGIPIGNLI